MSEVMARGRHSQILSDDVIDKKKEDNDFLIALGDGSTPWD
jgi:hypothetical protein